MDNTPMKPSTKPLTLFYVVCSGFTLLTLVFLGGTYYLTTKQPSKQEISTPSLLAVPVAEAATTSQRVINSLSISDTVPTTGKFIAADLVNMELTLYQDGAVIAEYPILTKGRTDTPFETPSGFYKVRTKETDHFSTLAEVHMPYSMQFYGNYFIHGWPYYPDGTPVASTYSGGCIRLSTPDAAKVFQFADVGTQMFVYDSGHTQTVSSLVVPPSNAPTVSAEAYLVADIDSGQVYREKNANETLPVASVTKLMTALVANEIINFEQFIPMSRGDLQYPQVATDTQPEIIAIDKTFYPLLMESNNAVASDLASFYGTKGFIAWMNSTADSLDMASTTFADPSGISPENISTVDDLYRLAVYLVHKKPFVFNVSKKPTYTLSGTNGEKFSIRNFNIFYEDPAFVGGKVGQTSAAGETMVSVWNVTVGEETHRVAIIVLRSNDYTSDTQNLLNWFKNTAQLSKDTSQAACAACANTSSTYRTISL